MEDLLSRPITGPRDKPSDVTTERLLDASVDAIVALLTDRAAAELRAAENANMSTFKAAFIALSRRSPAVHRLRRGYWHTVNTLRRMRGKPRPTGTP